MSDYARAAAFAFNKATQTQLESLLEAAGKAWKAIPGVGSGALGLTPDAVKFSTAYRNARADYETARKRLAAFNQRFTADFAGELKAERAERRAAGKL